MSEPEVTVPGVDNIAIAVENVWFSWIRSQPILRGCSLTVPAGEFWMLLGTNGSGKSTLLKVLTGLLTPTKGQVTLRQPTGFVFQNPDYQLVMPTVGADVAFSLAAEGLTLPETRLRVEEALDAVNLIEFQRRPIYALSGGQKQRVAIAGAIARHCPVLLLDEPTALLDPDGQIDLVQEVQHLVKTRKLTALWVTHRLEELDYCDGAFLMKNGQVIDQGDPKRLRESLQQSTTFNSDNSEI